MVSVHRDVDVAHRTEWSSNAYSTPTRFDAWQDTLNRTYCDFDMSTSASKSFEARVISHSLPSFGVIECICDPCAASRGPREISRDDPDVMGVQLVLAGKEHMEIDGEQYSLVPGDIIIWDSTRRMEFEVTEQLHKISLMLPLRRLKDWFPVSRPNLCQVIDGRTGAGRLLGSFIRSVSPMATDRPCHNGEALGESTMGLLCNAADRFEPQVREKLRTVQLQHLKAFIDARLDDPELRLADVAVANRISIRYLHWLFEPMESTAAEYIMERRLALCARDLRNPLMRHRMISEVCFAWGFTNATHFSRRFRRRYGVSPSEYRDQETGKALIVER
ncbi:MAG: helix-turn-helix domain-containing protein [Woeseia sp.]